jgi:hypothetical protein
MVGDACADILRASGISPVCKWVDDHLFIRICRQHFEAYNLQCHSCNAHIVAQDGIHHDSARLRYGRDILPDGQTEEFDKDMLYPMRDHSQDSPCLEEEQVYNYTFDDIKTITDQLGIPWECSKDIPFDTLILFIGLVWDLDKRTVSLADKKNVKYLAAILEWDSTCLHDLKQVQKLYGKLLHTCLVMPHG